ncbi:MAG: 2-oxo-4-hydroxy-4-carboxy-5-ureidoimidazoline decarboxylase, partial [Candidatus Limnocylindria bacterium]
MAATTTCRCWCPATAASRTAVAEAFERAPGLAERLAVAVGGSPDEIVRRARALIEAMAEAERIAVLDAHPRIGERGERLSAPSAREQRA